MYKMDLQSIWGFQLVIFKHHLWIYRGTYVENRNATAGVEGVLEKAMSIYLLSFVHLWLLLVIEHLFALCSLTHPFNSTLDRLTGEHGY